MRRICILFIAETLRKEGDINDPYAIFLESSKVWNFRPSHQQVWRAHTASCYPRKAHSPQLVCRFSKTYPLNYIFSGMVSRASNAFQRWTTGIWLISAIPSRMRSSSSLDCTRIPRRNVRVILPNRVSTMFSQEPCVGVSTYLNRLGRVARKARVSFEIMGGMVVEGQSNRALRQMVSIQVLGPPEILGSPTRPSLDV